MNNVTEQREKAAITWNRFTKDLQRIYVFKFDNKLHPQICENTYYLSNGIYTYMNKYIVLHCCVWGVFV